ncbi:MAG TPA: DUF72 domain-containing protein [Lysobacter sp.]|nr:DUF72 domain-containing protein [Lysobacter sp.]
MQTLTRPSIRIGCAGWGIDRHSIHRFGEGASTLARYATVFDCVEINSSFHRAHKPETYARWASAVPARFRFSVKLPKTITHEMRLERTGDALARFAEEVAGLGAKFGGLLVQLPPSLAYDARIAGTFFSMLRRRFDVPVACEPRHASWFADRVDGLWARYEVARVAADPAAHPGAGDPAGKGAWHYWRLHGAPCMYYSSYDEATLQALAVRMRAVARRNRSAWCIFDNTAHGHATANALRLFDLIVAGTG